MYGQTTLQQLQRTGAVAVTIAISAVVVLLVGLTTAVVRVGDRAGGTSDAAAGGDGIARGWVHVLDRAAGFAALLPHQPTDSSVESQLASGTRLTARVARAGHGIVIERIDVPQAAAAIDEAFRGAVDSLAPGTGFQVESEQVTSYRSQVARKGIYKTDNGSRYEVMIFLAEASVLYLIAAPTRYFNVVTTSFRRSAA
jgi:hypothetical protein